jgi:hypothetical protein
VTDKPIDWSTAKTIGGNIKVVEVLVLPDFRLICVMASTPTLENKLRAGKPFLNHRRQKAMARIVINYYKTLPTSEQAALRAANPSVFGEASP